MGMQAFGGGSGCASRCGGRGVKGNQPLHLSFLSLAFSASFREGCTLSTFQLGCLFAKISHLCHCIQETMTLQEERA